ncbi:homoserine kinase [Pleurocapsa sp. PCC 7319]|uniref:homoserine kinase n=1 Tax=Pleurocapsa sp. PCC 7319 TaxID=118161 RepID=UPI00034B07AE|nr:phosphotransferase [Pleurocapsa sp. PCC 7319]
MVAMGVFPAIYSTLSPQALIEGVLPKYELGAIDRCLFWNRGLSDIYLIETAAQSYILKVSHHHWRSKSDIQFELEFLDFLFQHHIPVANPLKTKDGKLFVTINAVEGDRYGALFRFAPGEVPLGDLSIDQSNILGQTLGRIHQTSLKFNSQTPRQPLNFKHLLDDSLEVISPCLSDINKDLSYLTNTIAKIKQQLSCLEQTAPFWSVCWGDPHSGNVHFTADNQITLFDFDQCGYGWRIFDIAKFLQVSLGAGMNRKVRDAFFAGYQTIQKLTDSETESLQAATQMAHIWAWAISINAAAIHNWSRLDNCYCSKRLQQLKRLSSKEWQLF